MKTRVLFSLFVATCLVSGVSVTTSAQETSASGEIEKRTFLGVRGGPLNERIRAMEDIKVEEGVIVRHVLPGSPAEKAGLKQFDVIREVNGVSVSSVRELSRKVQSRSPGETVELTIRRNGQSKTLSATLARYGSKTSSGEGRTDSSKRKKIAGLMKDMKEMEKKKYRARKKEDRPSARSPDDIRDKMKSFLQENNNKTTGDNGKSGKKKNGTLSKKKEQLEDFFSDVRDRFSRTIGKKLNSEKAQKVLQDLRSWVKNTSEEDLRSTMNYFLEQVQKQVKNVTGPPEEKLKEWKSAIQNQLKEQMKAFEKDLDKKMKRFEKRLKRKMKKYTDRMEKQVEELKRLKESFRERKKQKKQNGQDGSGTEPYLGVRPAPDPAGKGILIRKVMAGSPAEQAGLKKGDVIRKINGKPVKDLNRLKNVFYELSPGDRIELFVERDGWTRQMTIEVGKTNRNDGGRSSTESNDGKSGSDSSSTGESSSAHSDPFKRGKRTIRMMNIFNEYRKGNYSEVLKKGLRHGYDVLKEKMKENSVRLTGHLTLKNEENGNEFFSLPIDQNLSDTFHRVDRVVSLLLGKTGMGRSDKLHKQDEEENPSSSQKEQKEQPADGL